MSAFIWFKKKIKINKEVFLSDEFKKLWDKIKYKTTYQVNFNEEELIKECIKGLDNEIYIPSEKLLFNKKTNYLISGVQDKKVIKGQYSSKQLKAMKLKQSGQDINIIDENIFIEMLADHLEE